jgi:diguanylate cyclase (GGDEF)-like protein
VTLRETEGIMATPVLRAVLPGDDGAKAPGSGPRTEGQLVLLVGLDGSARHEASRWLSSFGLHVIMAEDAARGIELFKQVSPQIVFADMALRDDRGMNVCQILRQKLDRSDVPLLALCSSSRHAAEALASGASDLLERPYDWRVASLRAERLVRLAETQHDLVRARDEVEALKRTQEDERRERLWSAHYDALTGLPDVERLERVLESALVAASETRQVALAFFRIEHLVQLNSRLGRARANSVLQQVAQRLTAGLRAPEVMGSMAGPSLSMTARVGGGLFAVMLTGLRGFEEAKASLRHLLDLLLDRYIAGDAEEEIVLSVNVGVALAPEDGLSAEILLQKAELAAFDEEAGGSAVRFYGQSSHPMSERSRTITRLLPRALARGDFELHYQPLVEGSAWHVSSAEALLRWECRELGRVGPAEFVPLAEEAGMMVALGSWVLATACRQARTWLDQGLPLRRIAVNVSLCQLTRGDLAKVVRECLEETGLPASHLELELSERGVLRNDADILSQLQTIQALGVQIAIDDFGSGNSAVTYLKQFPIDVLKIDQSLVRGVKNSPQDAAITSATIAMARQLGLRVVAEGVEEQAQMDFLGRHGCNEYQGFLFSPAVPPQEFAELLRGGLGSRSTNHEGQKPDEAR